MGERPQQIFTVKGEPFSLLSIGEATPEALCLVLDSAVQEKHGLTEEHPMKRCKNY